MILASQTRSIHTVLEEAITTNNVVFTGEYLDTIIEKETPGNLAGVATNADTLIVPAPAANTRRTVLELNFYNADTVTHNIHVLYHDGADFVMHKATMTAKQTLHYNQYNGWYVL